MTPSDQCSLPDSSQTLRRLWEVLTDKHAGDQQERHLILLDTYLTVTGGCAWLRDLHLLSEVTALLVRRADLQTDYRQPLLAVLDILKQPFKMDRASDEINFKYCIIEFFTTLGCLLLQSKRKDIKLKIIDIVEGIMFTDRLEKSNMVPVRACVAGVEVSEFVECLADLMVVGDADLCQRAVLAALQITAVSRLSCWTLVTRGAVDTLLVRMTAAREPCCQLLWRLLVCTGHPRDWARIAPPSLPALRSLRVVLREEALVHNHPGHCDNSLHNVASLTLNLMHLFPHAEYVRSGLIEDIAFLATLTETVISIHILPQFKNISDYLKFKKLMIACLSLSPMSSSSITIFEHYKVAECLVAMLSGGEISNRHSTGPVVTAVSWPPEHAIDLFQCALPAICELFTHLPQHFINAGLMSKLVTFLKVHHFDEHHLPDTLAFTVVKTITSFCCRQRNKEAIQNALREADTVNVLLNLCKTILERELPLTLSNQSMLCHCLIVLATLMEKDMKLQSLHARTIIYIAESLYRRVLKPLPTDSLTDNRLLVSVSYFAWNVILWNKENALMFLKSGNVFSHIDILEQSTFSTQMVYLSVLTDLSEYEQCVPFLITWRGRKGIKLLSLMCRIWRAEETRLQVPRSEHGCITDIENPLMGITQTQLIQQETTKSVSIFDVFVSVRPKIYAIVQLLHRHKEVTEICEDHYKLGYDKLPVEDLITMKIIEAYLPLKMGEIWWEIRKKQDKVVPLDRYLAETLAERYLNWSLSVQRAQLQVLADCEALEHAEERRLYTLLTADRLTEALAALRELEVIARSTDREQQLRAHQRLTEGIERSRAHQETDLRTTYPRGLGVLPVSGQLDVTLVSDY